ncbi:MAG TPA: DUF86 domain-containing protein [Flavobacteriales bacterium]|nr:DUF86 domain-containing protein [Flavobacteriales bacterium]
MSKRSDKQLLLDMQEATSRVLRYTAGFDERLFLEQEQTIDSVVRNIQIIGEAASRISKEFRDAHPEIEWPGIIGMRHRLVHDYFEIEEKLIWRVIETKLPEFYEQLKKILAGGVE